MYGKAERVVGDLAAELGLREKLFFATKVWTSGREAGIRQMEDSFRLMRTQRMDLMQVHNLLDLSVHAKTLREWKTAGRIRYIGITHYHDGAHAELEQHREDARMGFRAVQLLDGGARSRSAAAAGVRRIRHRGDRQPSVLAGRAVSQGQGQGAAGVGRGIRLRELGAVLPQVPALASRGHLRHSRARAASRTSRTTCRRAVGRLPDAAMRRRMVEYLEGL